MRCMKLNCGLTFFFCAFARILKMQRHSTIVFAILVVFSSLSLAQTRRPMSPADLLLVGGVSDAQISPDGRWVVYSVSRVDGDRNQTTLWLARMTEQFSSQLATPAISNTD